MIAGDFNQTRPDGTIDDRQPPQLDVVFRGHRDAHDGLNSEHGAVKIGPVLGKGHGTLAECPFKG